MAIFKRSGLGAACVVALAGTLMSAGADDASANIDCGHDWAVPGKYTISGSFRGKDESTNAFLSKDCRITLQVPGVFTGGKVKKRGECVEFAFKIEGNTKAFQARWCDDYGLVPWQGKTLRTAVTPQFRRSTGTKTNF